MAYLSLKEAETYLDGIIKSRTLLKYVSLGLVQHYRIGIKSPGAKKDTRPIVFTAKQLDNLMQKFLVENNNEQKILTQIFPKPKPGGRNGTRKN